MKKPFVFFIIAGQLLFLCAMIWFHHAKVNGARVVTLKTVPYDPVSVFRGYFADLRYEISAPNPALLKDARPQDLRGGQELFVVLSEGPEQWGVAGVYTRKPSGDAVFIRGRLRDYYSFNTVINLEYGIESFFLNETDAESVDAARGAGVRRLSFPAQQGPIEGLDDETNRIRLNVNEWSFGGWKKEFDAWVSEGLIDEATRNTIVKKYTDAFAAINEADRRADESREKPIFVEVAVDADGYGYTLRLVCDGKVYR